MRRWKLFPGLILLAGVAGFWLFFTNLRLNRRPVVINNTAVPPVPTLHPDRVMQGKVLYQRFCAECHGTKLEGVADWKIPLPDGSLLPPPHNSTGHTWNHPDSLILEIVTSGGEPAHNSKMPAFKDRLAEDEMESILEFIKSKWGREEREYQWWITATGEDR